MTAGGATISPCTYNTLAITANALYANSETCIAILVNPNGGSISLTFSTFATQASQDLVTVYNGATTASTVLGTFSGATVPAAQTSTGEPEPPTRPGFRVRAS